jgi:hypothetical protein
MYLGAGPRIWFEDGQPFLTSFFPLAYIVRIVKKAFFKTLHLGGNMLQIQSNKARIVFGAILLLATGAAPSLLTHSEARAQTGTATLIGTVTDQSQAIISGAKVTLTNKATGITKALSTNGNGEFAAVGLPPGSYMLRAERTGFENFVVSNIVLNTGDRKNIPVEMKIGSISETVTVNTDAGLVTTESSVSNVVSGDQVQNLPLNGRSFQDLILLSPGATTNSPQSGLTNTGQTNSISVNGQGTTSNIFTVDGVSGNANSPNNGGYTGVATSGSTPAGTALGTTQALVSVDSLQEFRSETSSFSAEYGRSPGGQFSFTTKSGSRNFHGSAFDYLRNNFFDANDYFNNFYGVAQPALHQNDFGGTIGGFVSIPHLYAGRNRTFFFANYEGLRLTQPIAAYAGYVPSLLARNNATGNLQAVLKSFPLPNANSYDVCTDGNTTQQEMNCMNSSFDGTTTYESSFVGPSRIDSTSVRIDQVINPKNTLFFRVANTPSSLETFYVGAYQTNHQTTRTYTLGTTSAWTSRITNEFRANYTSSNTNQIGGFNEQGGATPTDYLVDFGYTDALPGYYLGLGYYGVGSFSASAYKSVNSGRQVNLVDSLSYALGKHLLKFGIDYKKFASTDLPESPLAFYAFYSGLASLDANILDSGSVDNYATNFPLFRQYSLYGQDDLRLTSRLTVSYGLRYELDPSPTANRNGLPENLINQNDFQHIAIAPAGTTPYKLDAAALAPRLGVSYLAHTTHGRETLIRAGGGVYYDTGTNQSDVLSGYVGPGFSGGTTFSRPGYGGILQGNYSFPATDPAILNPPITAATAPYTVTAYGTSPNLTLPYTWEVNSAVQQDFDSKDSLSITYVGAFGRKEVGGLSHYLAAAANTPSGFVGPSIQVNGSTVPVFQSIYVSTNAYSSNYNSLQLVFQHREAKNLYVYAGYTWSKSLGDVSLTSYVAPERTTSGGDVRHNFNAVLTYDVPGQFRNFAARSILEHWGIDLRENARTGFPINLYDQEESPIYGPSNIDIPLNYSPAYLAGTVPLHLYNTPANPIPAGSRLNPAAFTPVTINADGTFPQGGVPFNLYRGRGALQTNVAVRREFPLYREARLQFRAETFNIFNHPQFGGVGTNLHSPLTFGEVGSSLANSLGGLGAQYQGGGPRSMQFALKVLF